jgi:hypothetical protein
MKVCLHKIKKCGLNVGILVFPVIAINHLQCLVGPSPTYYWLVMGIYNIHSLTINSNKLACFHLFQNFPYKNNLKTCDSLNGDCSFNVLYSLVFGVVLFVAIAKSLTL